MKKVYKHLKKIRKDLSTKLDAVNRRYRNGWMVFSWYIQKKNRKKKEEDGTLPSRLKKKEKQSLWTKKILSRFNRDQRISFRMFFFLPLGSVSGKKTDDLKMLKQRRKSFLKMKICRRDDIDVGYFKFFMK